MPLLSPSSVTLRAAKTPAMTPVTTLQPVTSAFMTSNSTLQSSKSKSNSTFKSPKSQSKKSSKFPSKQTTSASMVFCRLRSWMCWWWMCWWWMCWWWMCLWWMCWWWMCWRWMCLWWLCWRWITYWFANYGLILATTVTRESDPECHCSLICIGTFLKAKSISVGSNFAFLITLAPTFHQRKMVLI